MHNYRHILVAVDFSEQDDYVIAKANALTQQNQAKTSIIHVLDNIPMPDTHYGTVISLTQDSDYPLLEIEKAKLMVIAERLDIDIARCWLLWGVPKQEIIHIAKQEGVDLIILGSHGRHGLALLLGSTANSVLHHAGCDVLAVRLPD